MSLSIKDARIFSNALKKARKKLHLTQATCAELLDLSVSFEKFALSNIKYRRKTQGI